MVSISLILYSLMNITVNCQFRAPPRETMVELHTTVYWYSQVSPTGRDTDYCTLLYCTVDMSLASTVSGRFENRWIHGRRTDLNDSLSIASAPLTLFCLQYRECVIWDTISDSRLWRVCLTHSLMWSQVQNNFEYCIKRIHTLWGYNKVA